MELAGFVGKARLRPIPTQLSHKNGTGRKCLAVGLTRNMPTVKIQNPDATIRKQVRVQHPPAPSNMARPKGTFAAQASSVRPQLCMCENIASFQPPFVGAVQGPEKLSIFLGIEPKNEGGRIHSQESASQLAAETASRPIYLGRGKLPAHPQNTLLKMQAHGTTACIHLGPGPPPIKISSRQGSTRREVELRQRLA